MFLRIANIHTVVKNEKRKHLPKKHILINSNTPHRLIFHVNPHKEKSVSFPNLSPWTRDTSDITRENKKRQTSPTSFFHSQGRALCLAAEYFKDERLAVDARDGVAAKHRHKNLLAIFGQLMAAFEYMLKDFVAKSIDATSVFDEKIKEQDWLSVTTDRVLSQRVAQTSIGSMLVHPTLGWHTPETVNTRFKNLFNCQVFKGADIKTLNTLWILRHSIAHNAGFVTAHDAARIGQPNLSEKVVDINAEFIKEAFDFLKAIANNIATTCGKSILKQWFKSKNEYEPDFARDEIEYVKVKLLSTCVASRTADLPTLTAVEYDADWQAFNV